ncbi:MAG: ATP-binding cassette domain-containing protein [Demequina sp.]
MTTDAWGAFGVTVRRGDVVALRDVSCEAVRGEVRCVVGGDGAGKTTLLRTLAGALRPDVGTVRAPALTRIGFMPTSAGVWRDLTVDENVEFVAAAHGVRGESLRRRRDELLAGAGLEAATDRLGRNLSGGMRQKLAFSLAMLHQPDLVILDEPSTGVDPVSRVDLWRMIAQAAAGGAAVLMATTYLDEAERTAHVLVLDGGEELLSGSPAQVLAGAPGRVAVVPSPSSPARAWRRGAAWHQWSPESPPGGGAPVADMEDAVIAASLAKRGADEREASAPAGAHARSTQPVHRPVTVASLTASRVTRRFGDVTAVDEVSLEVAPGEIVGLLGANGAGKTTLIRMALGLLPATSGELRLFGEVPSRVTRARLGYVPQGLGLWDSLTAGENLAFVAEAFGSSAVRLPAGLEASRDTVVGRIGLGGQRRLAFAAALGHAPELLVLDEPTSGVDPLSRARLWDTIHARAENGIGVLVSTHYMQEAQQCDRLVLMSRGRQVAEGTEREIIGGATAVNVATDVWREAFAALSAAGLLVALAGARVRVVGADESRVRRVLAKVAVQARLTTVPATLEEAMAAREREAGA